MKFKREIDIYIKTVLSNEFIAVKFEGIMDANRAGYPAY